MIEKTQSSRILVVDDEMLQRKILSRQLEELGFVVQTAQTAADALEILQSKDFDAVLLDIQMSDLSGLDVLPLIKKLEDAPEVIMLTFDKSLGSGVAAMRKGAYDYLTKPAKSAELEITLKKAVERRRLIRKNKTLTDFVESKIARGENNFELIQTSPAMRLIIEQADSVAALNSTILITGESGTGKDVLARYIHRRSRQAKSAMVSVNCGAMPETLFESEFFGYERGAFSGATQTKRGLIEAADGSTPFLGEIGELSITSQVKLLRFLESGEFRRVGSTRDLFSDARLIAATNQDLTQAIRENRFRSDLFFRLNVIHLHIPPLRERREDIPVLVKYFRDFYRAEFHKPTLHFSDEARQKLFSYDFPGNVRELKNIIERAFVLASNGVIEAGHLHFQKQTENKKMAVESGNSGFPKMPYSSFDTENLNEKSIIALEELERRYILSVLDYANGNRERAAFLLGISVRTLYRRLHDYE